MADNYPGDELSLDSGRAVVESRISRGDPAEDGNHLFSAAACVSSAFEAAKRRVRTARLSSGSDAASGERRFPRECGHPPDDPGWASDDETGRRPGEGGRGDPPWITGRRAWTSFVTLAERLGEREDSNSPPEDDRVSDSLWSRPEDVGTPGGGSRRREGDPPRSFERLPSLSYPPPPSAGFNKRKSGPELAQGRPGDPHHAAVPKPEGLSDLSSPPRAQTGHRLTTGAATQSGPAGVDNGTEGISFPRGLESVTSSKLLVPWETNFAELAQVPLLVATQFDGGGGATGPISEAEGARREPESGATDGRRFGGLRSWSTGLGASDRETPEDALSGNSSSPPRSAEIPRASLIARRMFARAFDELSSPARLPNGVQGDPSLGPTDDFRWPLAPHEVADRLPPPGQGMGSELSETNDLLRQLIEEVKRGRDTPLPTGMRSSGPLR